MQKILFGFLMLGLAFTTLPVATTEAVSNDHPCYKVEYEKRDGHSCWPKGEDPSVSVEGSGERDVKDETQGLYSDTGKRHKGIDVSGEKDNNKNKVGERGMQGMGRNTTNCAEGVNCKD